MCIYQRQLQTWVFGITDFLLEWYYEIRMMFMSAYIPAGCPNNGSANGQPHSGTTQASQSNHLKQQAPSTEKVQVQVVFSRLICT